MGDASNDKTIGRTNRSSPDRAAQPAVTTAGAAESVVSVVPPRANLSFEGKALITTQTVKADGSKPLVHAATSGTAGGGAFEWPTNSDNYQLINRIGQGAFASVWRARIIRRSNSRSSISDEDEEGKDNSGRVNKTDEIHCAIKIMDLEHVNINISGEFCFGNRDFSATYFKYNALMSP